MTVIGLTGLKGCGKDTAAAALVEDGWSRLAFADPLRQMLYQLNPIIGDADGNPHPMRWQTYLDLVGYAQAKNHPEVRRLMQIFGTEVMREMYGQNAWVDLAEQRIESEPFTQWVLTDVRFDNEAEMIRRLGGWVIEIQRDGLTRDGHASEAGVSRHLVDVILPNDGTVEDLHTQTRSVVDLLGKLRRPFE